MAGVMSYVIAYSQGRSEVSLKDALAGIYVVNFDRIVRFWPDAASLEDFVAEHCGWTENRQLTWERWLYQMRKPPLTIGIPFTRWFIQTRRKYSTVNRRFSHSEELTKVNKAAENMSPYNVEHFGKRVPLITPELFLLATANSVTEIARPMLESGLAIRTLQECATRPVPNPEKLMF
jgi:hypothetical protein